MKIKVNNITINYEKKGFGKPLIMLHGNGESIDIYDVLSEALKEEFELYLIDSRCHGKSDQTEFISYEWMANDIKAFMDLLKLDRPYLFGFSDGGIIGLLLSIKYPELLDSMMIAGANFSPTGLIPNVLEEMKKLYQEKKDPLYNMMIKEPNISPKDLNKIKTRTLILAGSLDVVLASHTNEMHQNMKNSMLKIYDGYNHDNYIIHTDFLKQDIIDFFKKKGRSL